jgi:hypothetical protein
MRLGYQGYGVGHVPAVVRVRGSADRDFTDQIARGYSIGIGSANACLRAFAKRVNPARAHIADGAAYAQLPKTALRLLLFQSVPGGLDILIPGLFQNFLRG